MKQVLRAFFLILISFFSNQLYASVDLIDAEILQQQRINTIKEYIRFLGKGEYQEIQKLFTSHAVAVSPTGESDSINHFYQTLSQKKLTSPQTKLINIFDGQIKGNMMTAYYNFTWKNPDGSLISKKFLDLFIFQADSTKIKTIYVFSNNFQDNTFDLEDSSAA